MGVKYTVHLLRHDALDRLTRLVLETKYEKIRNKLSLKSDLYIEGELERLNDIVRGGEGFENYSIEDKDYS
jgi:hypothetical protein